MLDIPCRIFSTELRIGLAYRSRETSFVVDWLVIISYAVIDKIAANFISFPLIFFVYSEEVHQDFLPDCTADFTTGAQIF